MGKRIIGFDLARAYAIFGMMVVNFNTVFGSHTLTEGFSGFLNLFNGNSSTMFVMLAGMGMSLMTTRSTFNAVEQKGLKRIIIRRSWFLFFLGLIFMLWWPADILYFYAGYMHIAVLLLFCDKKYYLVGASVAMLVFHLLLLIIPYETGWNFNTLQYIDFWTITGFIRNTFYNGWNPIFPWSAYFLTGMYLGRLDWTSYKVRLTTLSIGTIGHLTISILQYYASEITGDAALSSFVTADYLPPALPFLISTASSNLILINVFLYAGERTNHPFILALAKTGQMTLTHYISHLFFGLIIISSLSGVPLWCDNCEREWLSPLAIFASAISYFALSCVFSVLWLRRFHAGPFETLMRTIDRL